MKKLIILAVILSAISANGCKTLKTKKTERLESSVKTTSETKTLQAKVDSLAELQKGVYSWAKSTVKETATVKPLSSNDNFEVTANFKIDTNTDVKGDTAFKLVDINNKNVSVTVYHNRKTNQLTAKIKTGGKTVDTPMDEMTISRETTTEYSKGDTTKSKTEVKKAKADSFAKSTLDSTKTTSSVEKDKTVKPNYFLWVSITALVLGFVFIAIKYFRVL